MKKMKKKAEGMNFTVLAMVVAALMALLILWGFKTDFFSGMNIVGSTVDATAITACHDREKNILDDRGTYDSESHDKDADGIIDVCDICVLEVEKDDFDTVVTSEIKTKLEESGEERSGMWTYNKYSANSEDNDNDGIPDGCDAKIDSKDKATSGSGLKKNVLKSQCYALAKQTGDGWSADIRGETTQGYPQCHLVPTSI